MLTILKLREKKNGVKVDFDVDGNRGSFTASKEPAKSFVNALDGLKPLVKSILGFTDKFMETVRVTGITLSPFGQDNFRVTIVARKDLPNGSPFNISTPNRFLNETEAEEGEEQDPSVGACTLDEDARKAVEKLRREAERYVKGLTVFGQLFLPLTGGSSGPIQDAEVVGEQPSNVVQMTPGGPKATKKGRRRGKEAAANDDTAELPVGESAQAAAK